MSDRANPPRREGREPGAGGRGPSRELGPGELEAGLGLALAALAPPLGAAVERAWVLSPRRPFPWPRAAFRVALADGRTVKLRRLRTAEQALAIEACWRAADEPRLARLLARTEHVLVEEWVEGAPLPAGEPPAPLLATAARLLARLHDRSRAGDRALPFSAPASPFVERARADLEELAAAGGLERGAARALASSAAALARAETIFGLVHGDLCGENMVVDARGELRLIDNEALAVGPLARDLVRTRWRWGLAGPIWESFEEAYVAAGGRAVAPAEQDAWSVLVLARSACKRRELAAADGGEPLGRLRDLAHRLADDARASRRP